MKRVYIIILPRTSKVHLFVLGSDFRSFPQNPLDLPKSARLRMSWKICSFCHQKVRFLRLRSVARNCARLRRIALEVAPNCARSCALCFGTNKRHETASRNYEVFRGSWNLRSAWQGTRNRLGRFPHTSQKCTVRKRSFPQKRSNFAIK